MPVTTLDPTDGTSAVESRRAQARRATLAFAVPRSLLSPSQMTSVLTPRENMASPVGGLASRQASLSGVARPSPSKRAHSSASPEGSPALGMHDPDQSPRVSRTKLSNDSLAATRDRSDARREGLATPDTLPRTALAGSGESLVGLGVELAENGTEWPANAGQRERTIPPAPAESAQEQTRKLMAMGPDMASILSRMSSQHQ